MTWSIATKIFEHFISFTFFVTLLTWLSLASGAALTFIIRTDHGLQKTFKGFLAFCFPPALFKTPSSRIDAVFWVIQRQTLLLLDPVLLGDVLCATLTYRGLTNLFGPHAENPESTLVWVVVLVIVTIGNDFATFYTHYLDHKLAVMWEFHKVHHSAEFLNPLTNKRMHPGQIFFNNAGEVLVIGGLIGICSYVFSMPIYENTVIGLDAYFLLNALSFYHVRHSHIYMSYGWLEKWILSPAQHQLHHSREARHWDKNFGLFLSVWDRWFGTLAYATEPPGSFRVGLPGNEGAEYQTLVQLYTTPFIKIWKMARAGWQTKFRPGPGKGTIEVTGK